jgi:hypothetical protein
VRLAGAFFLADFLAAFDLGALFGLMPTQPSTVSTTFEIVLLFFAIGDSFFWNRLTIKAHRGAVLPCEPVE